MTSGAPLSPAVQKAVEYLEPRLPYRPTVGIVLGSGLGSYAEQAPIRAAIPYGEIPGFPPCTVSGHAGRLVVTDRCGPRVAILQGRAHRYEGLPLETVTRPIRVLAALGVETLIVTCAAGALGDAAPGDLMLIEDHLNLMGDNPLLGPGRDEAGGTGFVEMADAYDAALLALAERAGSEAGVPLRRGVLACVMGPSYETPAEATMLGKLGAHAVSMSVAPEVIVARALNLRVLGLALLTNRAGARLMRGDTHQEVLAVAESRAAAVSVVLDGVLTLVGSPPPGHSLA